MEPSVPTSSEIGWFRTINRVMPRIAGCVGLLFFLLATRFALAVPPTPSDRDGSELIRFHRLMNELHQGFERSPDSTQWQPLLDSAAVIAVQLDCEDCHFELDLFRCRRDADLGNFLTASQHCASAAKRALARGDSIGFAESLVLEADYSLLAGQFARARLRVRQAISIYLRHKKPHLTGPGYLRLARLALENQEPEFFIEMAGLATRKRHARDPLDQARLMSQLGNLSTHFARGHQGYRMYFDTALVYLQQAVVAGTEHHDTDLVVSGLLGWANCLQAMDSSNREVLPLLDSAIVLARKIDSKRQLVRALISKSEWLLASDDPAASVEPAQTAETIARRQRMPEALQASMHQQYLAYKTLGQTGKATQVLAIQINWHDSLLNSRINQQKMDALGSAELQQRAAELNQLSEAVAANRILALQERQTVLKWQFGGGLLLLGIAVALLLLLARSTRFRLRLTAMELQRKRSLLKPHYLSNSLSILQYQLLIADDPQPVREALTDHNRYVHFLLNSGTQPDNLLSEELAAIEAQFKLSTMASKRAIELHHNFDDLPSLRVPPQIIQTFAENSLIHGLPANLTDPKLTLHARVVNSRTLEVKIIDNGTWKEPTDRGRKSHGTGLLRDYLALLSTRKARYGFRTDVIPGQTTVTVWMPYRLGTDETAPHTLNPKTAATPAPEHG